MKMWCEVKVLYSDLVEVWVFIIEDVDKVKSFKQVCGCGGFVCFFWQEVNELIVVFNVYIIKNYGLDCVVGFLLILVMLMVFYVLGVCYFLLIGGICLSFYDWYCDLLFVLLMIWGE